MRSPRHQLSVLPEQQSEKDSDEDDEKSKESEHEVRRESEANENPPPQSIGTSPSEAKHGIESLPQSIDPPPNSQHGWLETFIARRITVSRRLWDSLQSQKKKLSRALLHDKNSQLAKQKGPRRSIFLMPIVSPFNPVCLLWMAMMLLFDLTYTASIEHLRYLNRANTVLCPDATIILLYTMTKLYLHTNHL